MTMTYLKIILPAIILTGCSVGSNNFGHHSQHGEHHGQNQSSAYAQTCQASACVSGYSISESGYSSGLDPYSNHGYQGEAYQDQSYSAPQHPSLYAYGSQARHHDVTYDEAHGAHSGYDPTGYDPTGYNRGGYNQGGYGQVPELRGANGPAKRAYLYGTLGASMYDVDTDIFGVQGRVGYQTASIIGAELEGLTGLSKEKESAGGLTARVGVDYTVGAFGVLRSNLTPRWSIHGRAGYHVTELSGELSDGVTSVDVDIEQQDGFAYGVGTEYALSQRDFIRADFTRYEQDFGTNDSVSIAYGRKF